MGLISSSPSLSRGCKSLVLSTAGSVVIQVEADGTTVWPEAVAADLAGPRSPDVAHLEHRRGELVEEGALVPSECVDQGPGAAVVEEPLVGGEHPQFSRESDEVPVVEGVRRDNVEVLLPRWPGGALPGEPLGELVVGSDESAAGLSDGVPTGERDEVGGVAEATTTEEAQERVHVGGGTREHADLIGRRRPQAVAAAEAEAVERASGEFDGNAGGEGEDVGAGYGGPAGAVDPGADVLHQLLSPRLQRRVGPEPPLRVQKDGRVAALREAVVEENPEEAGRDLDVTAHRGSHGGAHYAW